MTIRIKPGSFGIFQVLFPWPGTPAYQKVNDYKVLDKYFKEHLNHAEAGNFLCQISSNKIIYVYPKYVKNLDSCMRLLRYTIQQVKNAEPIIIREKKSDSTAVGAMPPDLTANKVEMQIAHYPKTKKNWITYAGIVIASLLLFMKLTSSKRRSTLE